MRILMFGRGVICSMLGWVLEGAGHNVEFYVRPGRAAMLGSSIALDIHDLRQKAAAQQPVQCSWNVRLREELDGAHDFDLIVVSVAHDLVAEVADFLAARVGGASILMLNNCWADPLTVTAAIPESRLVWGFPAAAGGFQQSGTLRGAIFPRFEFGTFGKDPSRREIAVRQLFVGAGFATTEQSRFRDWLWCHFAISAAFTAQQFYSRMPRLDIYRNREGVMEEVVLTVRELMPLLAARGVALDEQPELRLFALPVPAILQALAPMLDGRGFVAAVESHANPAELRHMLRDVLIEGERRGVALPRLQRAVEQKTGEVISNQLMRAPGW